LNGNSGWAALVDGMPFHFWSHVAPSPNFGTGTDGSSIDTGIIAPSTSLAGVVVGFIDRPVLVIKKVLAGTGAKDPGTIDPLPGRVKSSRRRQSNQGHLSFNALGTEPDEIISRFSINIKDQILNNELFSDIVDGPKHAPNGNGIVFVPEPVLLLLVQNDLNVAWRADSGR